MLEDASELEAELALEVAVLVTLEEIDSEDEVVSDREEDATVTSDEDASEVETSMDELLIELNSLSISSPINGSDSRTEIPWGAD